MLSYFLAWTTLYSYGLKLYGLYFEWVGNKSETVGLFSAHFGPLTNHMWWRHYCYINWKNKWYVVTSSLPHQLLRPHFVTFWPALCDNSRRQQYVTLTYRHIRSYIMWWCTIFSSQGTFSDGWYVTTLMMVDFCHMILSMTVSVLYMIISFCHENQFFCSASPWDESSRSSKRTLTNARETYKTKNSR
jgi:hypothetical protein